MLWLQQYREVGESRVKAAKKNCEDSVCEPAKAEVWYESDSLIVILQKVVGKGPLPPNPIDDHKKGFCPQSCK